MRIEKIPWALEMIEKKHLNMLIPFLPIRFRKLLNRKKNGVKQPISEVVRKDLTGSERKHSGYFSLDGSGSGREIPEAGR